jgi:hypothetical protein
MNLIAPMLVTSPMEVHVVHKLHVQILVSILLVSILLSQEPTATVLYR